MKILHYSTDDITGGAAKAAHRLHRALREAGHDSRMVVRYKKSDDPHVQQTAPPPPRPWASRFERARQHIPGLRRRELKASYMFNFDDEPPIDPQSLLIAAQDEPDGVDIICLHWVTGLLDVKNIRRLYDHYRCPIIWIPPDQEAVTGGCHYSFGCDGFTKECGCCPQLDSRNPRDRSHIVRERKRTYLAEVQLCFAAPTGWVAARIKESSLFKSHRVELIPYAIDPTVFRPFDRTVARDLLQLPFDKKVIFFGATYLEDRRKGMPLLLDALHRLAALLDGGGAIQRADVFLLVAGLQGQRLLDGLPFAGKYVGHLNSDLMLALAYQAADVFVCPSVEEAGPMMIPEAMLCGLPVVAFDTGGAPDIIKHRQTGYLAALGDSDDLARGIYALLTAEAPAAMREAARQAGLAAHAPAIVVARHLALYRSLLGAHGQAV
ncbi:MAG: glycosyltransferase [Acidobacteriota bacterium]